MLRRHKTQMTYNSAHLSRYNHVYRISLSLKLTARTHISPGRLQGDPFSKLLCSNVPYVPALAKHAPYHPLPFPGRECNITRPRLKYTSTTGVKICKPFISALSLYDDRTTPAGIHNTPLSVGEYDHRGATRGWEDCECGTVDPSHYGVKRALWTTKQTNRRGFGEPDNKSLTFRFAHDLAAIANSQ
jgi:hypothetical protein